jgi:hypothetical protein
MVTKKTTKKKTNVFQVKQGGWKSKEFKSLKSALKIREDLENEALMDGSGDVHFPEITILKNGKRLAGY